MLLMLQAWAVGVLVALEAKLRPGQNVGGGLKDPRYNVASVAPRMNGLLGRS